MIYPGPGKSAKYRKAEEIFSAIDANYLCPNVTDFLIPSELTILIPDPEQ